MRVFTTKYALTAGIEEHEVKPWRIWGWPGLSEYVYTESGGALCSQQFKMGKTAFEDREDAVTAALEMRDKKIKSIQKQMSKLIHMKFT